MQIGEIASFTSADSICGRILATNLPDDTNLKFNIFKRDPSCKDLRIGDEKRAASI